MAEDVGNRSLLEDAENSDCDEVLKMKDEDIIELNKILDSNIKGMKSQIANIDDQIINLQDKTNENREKLKKDIPSPSAVANIIEVLTLDPQENEVAECEHLNSKQNALLKINKETYILPVTSLVSAEEMKPGDLVKVNKDSLAIIEKLPSEFDYRAKAMLVGERPTEQYSDIGGLDKQIKQLKEAVVLPLIHKDKFDKIGIQPPKGVLMYGPPGIGKTMLARACAAQTKSTFIRLAGSQLVQMYIGEGAYLVRNIFQLAKEMAPTIIFIDELDAVGTKRFDSLSSGDRETQRTMLELLNQLDSFQPNHDIKVIAATNRIDILDPALLRSGRFDQKIEFTNPTEEARARILQIHSRKMNISDDVNFDELGRSAENFNGAQCRAMCLEAGMIALRKDATVVTHEDFIAAISEVRSKVGSYIGY